MFELRAHGSYINAVEARPPLRPGADRLRRDGHGIKHFLAIDGRFRESTESLKALLQGASRPRPDLSHRTWPLATAPWASGRP